MANTKNISRGRVSFSIFLLVFSFSGLQFVKVVDAAAESISVGQVVTRSETLVSAGKFFELGFFRPGQSSNYYVGIWYMNISEQVVVWVANRDLPLTGSSPILSISNDGNLVITEGKITYRVSDIASSQNTSAVLLDSGNLILRNGNSDILWQSFDYPSHTFLPGMKFGYSRKTGKVWSLTSWKSAEDPSVGNAELKMDPDKSNEIVLMRDNNLIWRSGVWQGDHFAEMPEMRLNYIYNYSFHSDENGTYFVHSMKDSTVSRFIIDVNGQIKSMSWLKSSQAWVLFWAQPKECGTICGPFSICNVNVASFCPCLYGFIPSESRQQLSVYGGCVRRTPLQCENRTSVNGGKDRFLRMDAVKFHIIPKELKVRAEEECKLACLKNCSCTAYAHNNSGVCLLWNSGELYIQQLAKNDRQGRTIYIKLAASELPKPGGNKKLLWMIVIVVPLALLASCLFLRWRRQIQEKETESSQDMLLFDINMSIESSANELSNGDKAGKVKSKDSWLPLFSFTSVSASTNGFSTENKLGEGGFGPVYKGKLMNGQEVAVKRLSKRSGQGLEELKNETMLIAKLQHRNLVRLLGFCLEHGEKILIYDYMPNKSLDSFLFDPTKKGLLAWGTRVKIIEGIAQGLLYLHQYSRLRIIHRDLKASNILLDSDMNPKISDFGMARMFGGDELQANTNRIVGTYGYMSPEYALEGIFSIKSDVFSFGVLLLEILSSKKNTGFYHAGSLNLLGYSWDLWKDDRALDLMDPILRNEASHPIVIRYITVALLCVQENAADRPTMSEVLTMITNEVVALPSPKQPAFTYVRSVDNSYPATSRPEACSVNDVTVSLMEAR